MAETNYNLNPIEFDPFAGPEIVKVVPAIEPQVEIWASYLIGGYEANCSYNESVSLRLHGPLNQQAMERSIQDLVERHEALRSGFSADGKQLCIFKSRPAEYRFEDLSSGDPAGNQKFIDDFSEQNALTPFDLINGPLFRVALFKLNDNEHYLTLSAHHIICDGWSLGIVMQDLSILYSAYSKGEAPAMPEAPSFSKYAAEQNEFLKSKEYKEIEQFWVDQYKGEIPILDIPTDFPRPAYKTYKSNRDDFVLNPDLVASLKKIGSKAGCSFVTTFLAAFEVFLHRLCGQEDIVLGVPAAGQSASGNYDLVGHCVNLLPLKSHHDGELGFMEFLKQRRKDILDAYDHQQFTFGTLLKKLNIPRDASRVPLIPVVVNIDIGLDEGVSFEGLTYELISNKREYENFEIFLNATGSVESLTLEWSYNTQLLKPATISRMMEEFEFLLYTIVNDPDIKIRDIRLSDSHELENKLIEWNDTAAEYPRETPLHDLITRRAAEFPDKIILQFNNENFTYKKLIQQANQLAGLLLANNVQVGDKIGLAVDRSPEMLIALLAIMKSGAAYVPLDPAYPRKRIEYMLEDSSAEILLTSRAYEGKFTTKAREIFIEDAWKRLSSYPKEDPKVNVSGNDLAYVMYTSGSSGKPKGTPVEHHSLVNFLFSMLKITEIVPADRLLAVTTVSFDIAGLELFLPLISGSALLIADSETTKDGRALLGLLQSEKVSIMQATPSTWRMIIEAGWDVPLKLKALCGGEALPKDLAKAIASRCAKLWNMYGPTETTIWSTVKPIISLDDPITIGRPIANTQVYILDRYQKLVPQGSTGEIYIAGDGLARGYLNKPELTAKAFVSNPFSTEKNSKMYRTGDLGRFMPDGEIQYLGRTDNQVKIRGHRVELGSIEDCLNMQKGIKEAVVIVREDRPGDQRLVAYIVPEKEDEVNKLLSWHERWESLYERGIQSEKDLDLSEQYLDAAVIEQQTNKTDIRLQIQEWLKQSVKRILDLKAKSIMEVGCGAGQLLLKVAPSSENFYATDFSKAAIGKLEEILTAEPKIWKNVHVATAAADDFSGVKKASLDLVILHSVAQYFQDASYLFKVIQQSAKVVRDGGCIFIGDMQCKSSLTMLHAFDQLDHSDDELNLAEFKKIVERRVKVEDELLADPGFFYLLPELIPEIAAVNVQLREGKYIDETTKYHYDIWLYVNTPPAIVKPDVILDWDPSYTSEWVEQKLSEHPSKILQLKKVFNSRTSGDYLLNQLINKFDGKTRIKELKEKLKTAHPGVDPNVFWELGRKLRYNAHVRWDNDGTDGCFDVVFIPDNIKNSIPEPPSGIDRNAESPYDFTRTPFFGEVVVSSEQLATWKQALKELLPNHMIPGEFVLLKKLPLSPSGKIDKSALPKPDQISAGNKDRVLPRTDVEKLIATIWAESLGLEIVGVNDDFFELGGHSLIAVQVMIRLEKETGHRLPLATLFSHSTVEEMAQLLKMDSKSITWDSLVPIKTHGDKIPLYIVHGAGLNVLIFNTLAKNMDDDQPVYGLQAQGLNGVDDPLERIEDMAAHYISEILSQNPNGPYAMAGFSFGGIIAFEMAKQLKAMGKEVKMLAMFDTYAYQSYKFAPWPKRVYNEIRYFTNQLLYSFVLLKDDPKRAIEYKTEAIKRRLIQLYWKLKYGKDQKQEGFFGYAHNVDEKNDEAWENYILTPYSGSVELFRAKKRTFYMDDFEYLGWKPFAQQVNIYEIPGEHNYIFAPPNDEEFARILQNCLNNAV